MSEWQPIETAPKDGTEIIGWNGESVSAYRYINKPDDDGDFGWCISQYRVGGFLYEVNSVVDELPTHWMPLPEPPII